MSALLLISLEADVPLWIERHRATPEVERATRRQVCSAAVAAHGDILQFKSTKAGETADVFNRLAEGLALAAFAPGGVTFHGQHWEAT